MDFSASQQGGGAKIPQLEKKGLGNVMWGNKGWLLAGVGALTWSLTKELRWRPGLRYRVRWM